MSLKQNIAASYASQIYVTVIGIVLVPLYIKYMGAEAYGLVGFFAMLQAWFNLLDLGLTPTIARESARYHGGSLSALAYRQLFRGLTTVFIVIAVVGGGGLWFFSEVIATRWINTGALTNEVLVFCVQVMALSVAMRWLGGLYRGVITGAERLVWLSGYNVVIATLRFVVVFASMVVWGYTPTVFFLHQLVVACIELLALYLFSRSLLPSLGATEQGEVGWSLAPVKGLLKFSLGIAFSSSVWVMVTQTDKLILSGILPLSEYGYFTLAVLVANGVLIISGPITNSILPRMTRLHAEHKEEELIQLYRQATQLIVVIAGSAAITIAILAEPLLFAWTGDPTITNNAAKILQLYVIGNGFLIVGAFPYYLQYARGNIKYHNIGNALTIGIMIPCIIYFSTKFGAVGAAWTWMLFHLFGVLLWSTYVHTKLQPGLHLRWISKDILVVAIPAALSIELFNWIFEVNTSRMQSAVLVAAGGVVALGISMVFSSSVRSQLFK
jgi:O-antigen/teichoic acid export membrane protein